MAPLSGLAFNTKFRLFWYDWNDIDYDINGKDDTPLRYRFSYKIPGLMNDFLNLTSIINWSYV